MVLMGLLALALALSAVIPQMPPQARDDPQAWLAVQAGPVRQGGALLRSLGLLDLYHSFWFRFLLVLTGLNLFVRAVESV
jgi:cytochrome c biogenesis protein ResB